MSHVGLVKIKAEAQKSSPREALRQTLSAAPCCPLHKVFQLFAPCVGLGNSEIAGGRMLEVSSFSTGLRQEPNPSPHHPTQP